MIREIKTQLFNACTRKCDFCIPYGFNDCNGDTKEFVNLNHVYKFVKYGIENEYIARDAYVSCYRYSEPTLHIDLVKDFFINMYNISCKFKFKFETNGSCSIDVLRDFLDFIKNGGYNLPYIKINLYDCDLNESLEYIKDLSSDMEIDKFDTSINSVHFKINGLNTLIILMYSKHQYFIDNPSIVSSRCNVNERYITKPEIGINTPCYLPKYFIGIDSNGNIMPCCEYYSRVEHNKNEILSNINHDNCWDEYLKNINEKIPYNNSICNMCDNISHKRDQLMYINIDKQEGGFNEM